MPNATKSVRRDLRLPTPNEPLRGPALQDSSLQGSLLQKKDSALEGRHIRRCPRARGPTCKERYRRRTRHEEDASQGGLHTRATRHATDATEDGRRATARFRLAPYSQARYSRARYRLARYSLAPYSLARYSLACRRILRASPCLAWVAIDPHPSRRPVSRGGCS